MIELIEANGPGVEFYNSRLPASGWAIRHHHMGYVVPNAPAWADLRERQEKAGARILLEGGSDDFLRYCYYKGEALGHYLEFFLISDNGLRFFEQLPSY